jgi:hypothetical protein
MEALREDIIVSESVDASRLGISSLYWLWRLLWLAWLKVKEQTFVNEPELLHAHISSLALPWWQDFQYLYFVNTSICKSKKGAVRQKVLHIHTDWPHNPTLIRRGNSFFHTRLLRFHWQLPLHTIAGYHMEIYRILKLLVNPVIMLSSCRHADANGKRRYSSNSFLTSALYGGAWSVSGPGRALPPGKNPKYLFCRGLCGP